MLTDKPSVMIIAPDGRNYAEALPRGAADGIPKTVCRSVGEAREHYDGQPVLFGVPDMIAEIIDDLPEVRWVQSMWAGVRPLLERRRKDYTLTGVKDVFGSVMAEYVIGHLLARELKILQRAKHQGQREWHAQFSGTLQGKRAGIMGTGSIGRHIANMLEPFGVRVRGLNRSGRPSGPFGRVFPRDRLVAFLQDLDYLISVLPDTPQTRRMLDADALAALPPRAILVNVGRGNVLDYPALIDALELGRLAGAVLDVFEEEPLPPDNPLWDTPNLTITGHVAAPSLPAEITPVFVDNYRRYCDGRPLRFEVAFDRGY